MWIAPCAVVIASGLCLCVMATVMPKDEPASGRTPRK